MTTAFRVLFLSLVQVPSAPNLLERTLQNLELQSLCGLKNCSFGIKFYRNPRSISLIEQIMDRKI
jgi:hypothetical protein